MNTDAAARAAVSIIVLQLTKFCKGCTGSDHIRVQTAFFCEHLYTPALQCGTLHYSFPRLSFSTLQAHPQ